MELQQNILDCVRQGKYRQCAAILANLQFDLFDIGEWLKCNSALVCEIKLSSKKRWDCIKKKYEELLRQIEGVILNDDLVNLLSVAAHNVVHAHLLSELSAPNAVITCLCSKAGDYLQEAMKCRIYLLLYATAVVCILNSDFQHTKILVYYIRERLQRQSQCDSKDQLVNFYVLCCSEKYTKNDICNVLLHLCYEVLTWTQFLCQEVDPCLQSMEMLEENQQILHTELRYLKCWLYFKKKRFSDCIQYADTQISAHIHSNKEVAARFLNIMGCCLSCQGKYHSAIQKFQKALTTDFSCLNPLYNISLQYRHLELSNAELECLNLLLSALQKNGPPDEKSHHTVTVPCSVLEGCESLSGEVSEVQVLYVLAKRCYQLQRYDKGSEKYKELMKLITSADTKPQLEQPVSSVLPEICLHQVYKEAALCLLCAGQYTDCVLVCDKFLQAMGIGNSDSFCTGLQSARQSMPENLEEDEEDFFGLLTDENVVLELKEMRQTQQISGCGKEYKSSGSADYRCHNGMLAVMCHKAEALAHTGAVSEAIDCLNMLTDTIENHQEMNMKESKNKRPKLEEALDLDSDKTSSDREETMGLLQSAYLNKSILLMAEKNYLQALQVSRLSLQLNQACETSVYVHVLALLKLDRLREGCHTWLSHRKLEVRGDSLHVQHLLSKRTDLLRSTEQQNRQSTG